MKRYDELGDSATGESWLEEDTEGEWVKYKDVEHLQDLHLKAQRKLCLQQAEIDRLRKQIKEQEDGRK